MAAELYAPQGVELVQEQTGPITGESCKSNFYSVIVLITPILLVVTITTVANKKWSK